MSQALAVLTDARSVGVMGDGRTYSNVVALRAVTTDDFMTADWNRPSLRSLGPCFQSHRKRDTRREQSGLRHQH